MLRASSSSFARDSSSSACSSSGVRVSRVASICAASTCAVSTCVSSTCAASVAIGVSRSLSTLFTRDPSERADLSGGGLLLEHGKRELSVGRAGARPHDLSDHFVRQRLVGEHGDLSRAQRRLLLGQRAGRLHGPGQNCFQSLDQQRFLVAYISGARHELALYEQTVLG